MAFTVRLEDDFAGADGTTIENSTPETDTDGGGWSSVTVGLELTGAGKVDNAGAGGFDFQAQPKAHWAGTTSGDVKVTATYEASDAEVAFRWDTTNGTAYTVKANFGSKLVQVYHVESDGTEHGPIIEEFSSSFTAPTTLEITLTTDDLLTIVRDPAGSAETMVNAADLNTEDDSTEGVLADTGVVGISIQNNRVGFSSFKLEDDGGGGGITQTVGLATETDTALAASSAKAKSVGLATETASALASVWSKSVSIGLSSEVNSALAAASSKALSVGLALETDTALSATVGPTTQFPTVNNVLTQVFNSGGTSISVNMPSTVNSGDLLFIGVTNIVQFGEEPNTPSGWTKEYNGRSAGTDGTGFAKVADGSEGGTSVTITYGRAVDSATSIVYRVSSWQGTLANGLNSGTAVTGNSTSPNPPSVSGDSGSNLFLAISHSGGTGTYTGFPTNYSNGNSAVTSTSLNCGIGGAERELSSDNDDPGSFTIDNSRAWIANTLLIEGTPGQTVSVGIASSTESAFGVTSSKVASVGLALETNSALASSANRSIVVGQAVSTETALTVSVSKAGKVVVGQATSNELALSVGAAKARAIGLGVSTETALAATANRTHQVGQATTTETALTVGRAKQRSVGIAVSSDISLGAGAAKAKSVGLATSSEVALSAGVLKEQIVSVGIATDSNEALTLTHSKSVVVGRAVEIDTALRLQGVSAAITRYIARVVKPGTLMGRR